MGPQGVEGINTEGSCNRYASGNARSSTRDVLVILKQRRGGSLQKRSGGRGTRPLKPSPPLKPPP